MPPDETGTEDVLHAWSYLLHSFEPPGVFSYSLCILNMLVRTTVGGRIGDTPLHFGNIRTNMMMMCARLLVAQVPRCLLLSSTKQTKAFLATRRTALTSLRRQRCTRR